MQHLRPVTRDPGGSGNKSKNPENLAKLRCGCGGARMGAAQEDFLDLQPGTVPLLVEKLFRGVSKSMHASLPVHGARLHDRDDPRVLAQPFGRQARAPVLLA